MMSSSVDSKGRKVADRGNEALSMDVVKLLKTQDAAYIRTMLQQVRRERQKLEERLILEEQGEVRALKDGENARTGKHRVFVENTEEQEDFDIDTWFGEGKALPSASKPELPADHKDTSEEDDGDEEPGLQLQKKSLSAKKQREQEEAAKKLKKFEKTRSRAQSRTAFRLQMVKKKERELVAAEEELEKQRAKMNSSVGGVNKNGVKFKIRERKR